MEHKSCGGRVVETTRNAASLQLRCLKCGRIWSVYSDFCDIEAPELSEYARKPSRASKFHNFRMRARAPAPMIDFLFNNRLTHVTTLIDFSARANMEYVLEVGCATGYYTQYLKDRLHGTVIGIDVDRYGLYRAKIRERLMASYERAASHGTMEFVCCDVNHLPIEKNSLDLVLCVSVLEHINDLDGAIKGIKDSMKEKGILVAGYPIETDLFRALLHIFLPSGMRIRDSRILGKEEFYRSPETHKQSFSTIRRLLQRHFLLVCEKKSFATRLPDTLSWYECVKMRKAEP